MMGPLHIEMTFLSTIGDWLDGCGWLQAFEKANIATIGRIESFFDGKESQANAICPSALSCNINTFVKIRI